MNDRMEKLIWFLEVELLTFQTRRLYTVPPKHCPDGLYLGNNSASIGIHALSTVRQNYSLCNVLTRGSRFDVGLRKAQKTLPEAKICQFWE